jgi:glucokinase
LGGTFAKGALVDENGQLTRTWEVPTGAEGGYRAVVENLVSLGRKILGTARLMGESCLVFGLAVPGLVEPETGIARYSANLGWKDLPLADIIGERLGVKVKLSQDVAAGGLAEHRFGAAKGAHTAVVVPIGTGIAAAMISKGKPFQGAHGQVIELGHLRMSWSDEPCPCGGTGCVERLASASAIGRRYLEALAASGEPIPGESHPQANTTPKPTNQAQTVDSKYVADKAKDGDPLAIRIWNEAIRALAEGLHSVVTVVDPDVVVFGGGLSNAGDQLLIPLREQLESLLTFQTMPELRLATLGSKAGVVGAALSANEQMC